MTKRSPRSALGLAFLKRPYNDVDIFVEDTANNNTWLFLLRRLLPAGTRLASINALGGRESVLAACRADQAPSGRRRLYIIDGDFDYLLGRGVPRLTHLYRLNAYCLENLLLNEASISAFAMRNATGKTENDTATDLDYPGLLSDIQQKLIPLFIVYAVAYASKTTRTTSGRAVNSFLNNGQNGPELCAKKIRQVMFELSREAAKRLGAAEFSRLLKQVRRRAGRLDMKKCVSGKTYIAPLLLFRISRTARYRGSLEQMLQNLAADFDPRWERGLSTKLKSL